MGVSKWSRSKKIVILGFVVLMGIVATGIMISNMGFSSTRGIGTIPIDGSDPIWNEEKKEISLNMSFASIDGENYPNAKVVIGYYKDSDMNDLIETRTLHNLKMEK